MKKTLAEMAEEVYELNVAHGWYEESRAPDDDIALLHTEVSEAFDAYRSHGFNDAFTWHYSPGQAVSYEVSELLERFDLDEHSGWAWGHIDKPSIAPEFSPDEKFLLAREGITKPEGVGSELADVLIRLLDTARRRGWDRIEYVDRRALDWPTASFSLCICDLHERVDAMRTSHPTAEVAAARVYDIVRVIAQNSGIDLDFEYERKMAYNRTRPYKHGGKRL